MIVIKKIEKMDTKFEEALNLVTVEIIKSLTYGQEYQLNDKYCLYHYSEDDLIVLNDSEEWVELYTVLFNPENNEVIFEPCQ
jgi:hypothetical protein